MKILNKLSFAILTLSLFLVSCAALRMTDMNKVSIGMTEESAYKSLGRNPDVTIQVKQYSSGTLKVVEYTTNVANDAGVYNDAKRPGKYWLYFFNGKLAQYGRPGDLQAESEHIVSMEK